MAVRHGYGKVVTDGLVFAYDTGDTVNSYKGEPTTNHIDGGSDRANAISAVWYFGNHAGADSSQVGVGEYYSRTRPNILRVKSTNGVGYGMINQRSSIVHTIGTTYTYSFDYKQIAYGGTFVPSLNVYGDGYKVPDSANYYANLVTRILDLEDGWKRFEATYEATYAGRNTYRTNMQTGDTTNFEILFDNFQIETKTHATSFTSDTRSATEGLLDLTGNNTIDLNNVSFDSNAQMTFDGTDDKVVIENFPHLWDGSLSVEAVVSWDDDSRSIILGNYNVGANDINFEKLQGRKMRFYWNRGERDIHSASNVVTTTGEYHHVVFTRDTTFRIYVNGELVTESSTNIGTDVSSTGSTFRVGGDTRDGATIHNGNIPVVKAYNRALTATEVAQNYGHYKTRFGI